MKIRIKKYVYLRLQEETDNERKSISFFWCEEGRRMKAIEDFMKIFDVKSVRERVLKKRYSIEFEWSVK